MNANANLPPPWQKKQNVLTKNLSDGIAHLVFHWCVFHISVFWHGMLVFFCWIHSLSMSMKENKICPVWWNIDIGTGALLLWDLHVFNFMQHAAPHALRYAHTWLRYLHQHVLLIYAWATRNNMNQHLPAQVHTRWLLDRWDWRPYRILPQQEEQSGIQLQALLEMQNENVKIFGTSPVQA